MTRLLLTGGCGFIGHHFVEHFLKSTDWDIVVLDKLNYASSGLDRLRDIEVFDQKRVLVLTGDFSLPINTGLAKEIGDVDYIIHMGAESHVDRSIENPVPFVISNVLGTMRLLDFARTKASLKKFFYFSTDEVFGPAPEAVNYKEGDRHNPGNPYAATKAGAEDLCIAYANTYCVPIMITNTMNVFGERQHPEKFIPLCIRKILAGETLTIHSNPTKTQAGTRFYIHARNVAAALHFLIREIDEFLSIHDCTKGKYNIVGEREMNNLALAQFIAHVLGKELQYEMVDFHSSRPGHDLRYALDGAKLEQLGWQVPKTFEESLQKTIHWYLENPRWLELEGDTMLQTSELVQRA